MIHFLAHQHSPPFKYPEKGTLSKPQSVSILTGSFNHAHFLRHLIYRLVHMQDYRPQKYEIVIGDTGSNQKNIDATIELMEEYRGIVDIVYVYVDKNKERAEIPHFHAWSFGINAALKYIRNDIVIYCDSSILVPPYFIHRLAGPQLLQDKLFLRTKTLNYSEKETKISIEQEYYKKSWEEIWNLLSVEKYSLGRTAWSVPTKELRAVGGADEHFTHYACHDDDMILRLMQNGCKNMMSNVPAIHQRHGDTDRNATDKYNEKILKDNLQKGIVVANQDTDGGKCDWIVRNF